MPALDLTLPAVVCLMLLILLGPASAADKLYVTCSTPDNQWVSDWPPVDSPATVQAMLEWLHDTWGVSRVYWRGEQARMWLEHADFRPENPRRAPKLVCRWGSCRDEPATLRRWQQT